MNVSLPSTRLQLAIDKESPNRRTCAAGRSFPDWFRLDRAVLHSFHSVQCNHRFSFQHVAVFSQPISCFYSIMSNNDAPNDVANYLTEDDAPITVPDSGETGEGGKVKMIVQLVKKCLGVKDIAAMFVLFFVCSLRINKMLYATGVFHYQPHSWSQYPTWSTGIIWIGQISSLR